MERVSNQRQRVVHVVSLAESPSIPKEEGELPNDLPTLLSNLRQILLKKSQNDDEIDSTTLLYINSIKTKIQELSHLTQSTEIFDILQATLKTYINDLLSITKCLNILSNETFQEIFFALYGVESTIDLSSIFENNPLYARTVFYRSFDFFLLPVIVDFLNGNYPIELFSHIAYVFRVIIYPIQSTIAYIVFKKNDLQNQIPNIRLTMEFIDRNKQNSDQIEMPQTINSILNLVCVLVDDTILVPSMIETNCSNYTLNWISMKELPLDTQRACMYILYNIARHEQGVKVLNDANCISVLREFKKRTLDPNKDNNDDFYVQLRLVYCMILSLLTEPKENREDLNNIKNILDRLMQLAVDAGQSDTNRCNGFHVSEPIVVLTKLCVHDEILTYVLNESSVENMQAKSKIDFFCQLLMKFRGALASEDELDQLTLTALFNIIWSISFHDQYVEELKSDSKFLITLKSLANDDGEALVEQYVPKQMSSIAKAANGILWNLDENNPARIARTTTTTTTLEANKIAENDAKKTNQIHIMVSYAHADQEFCHQLVDALQKDACFDVWVDFAHCHTEDLWEEIAAAIEKTDVVLFLMSKDYQDSKSCRQEVMYAKDSLKKRFIPIYIKKDFVPTGWLGVRIVGPQYIRFGKRSFDDTIKELIKLIREDRKEEEKAQQKDETKPSSIPSPVIENKPIQNTNNQTKPIENTDNQIKPIENSTNQTKPIENNYIESGIKPLKKPIEKWTKKDILQWFSDNYIHQELIELYDFQHGTDLLYYSQCLRPDWQIEYNDMRQRYQQKYNTLLYRDQFVRFVGALNRLQPSQSSNSRLCIIS